MKSPFLPRVAAWRALALCALPLSSLACVSSRAQGLAAAPLPVAPLAAAPLQIRFDDRGLQKLVYNGVTLTDVTQNGGEAFSVVGVAHLDKEGKISGMEGQNPTQSFDGATKTLTLAYQWGRVLCHYVPLPDRLDLDISVENNSKESLAGLNIFPVGVHFAAYPPGFDGSTPHVNFNLDGPSVQSADFGAGKLIVVNRGVQKPLAVGFTTTNETPTTFRYGVYVGSAPLWYQPNNWPQITRPIAPGGSDTYQISLRFAPPQSDVYAVAADVYRDFAAAYPFQNKWDNRRPIGALFLSSASDNHSAQNPRGWFNNDAKVDISTAAGRARFEAQLMEYADSSIAELKKVGAQGMITWDIEGQEYPHAISYIGDPRLVSQLAPEMEPLADAYFKKFRDAGFKVGVCVRPQQFERQPDGKGAQRNVEDEAAQLIAKIQTAQKRWQTTLFYVDSNGGPFDPSDAEVFQRVARACPGILLMPEHQNFKYHAYTAPYNDLRFESSITPTEVRRAYPRAFSVINAIDGGVAAKHHDALVKAVRDGDILLFNAWFDSEEGRAVKEIYAQAAQKTDEIR